MNQFNIPICVSVAYISAIIFLHFQGISSKSVIILNVLNMFLYIIISDKIKTIRNYLKKKLFITVCRAFGYTF